MSHIRISAQLTNFCAPSALCCFWLLNMCVISCLLVECWRVLLQYLAHPEVQSIPRVILLHHLFVHAPDTVPSPHTFKNMPAAKYVTTLPHSTHVLHRYAEWLETHTEDEATAVVQVRSARLLMLMCWWCGRRLYQRIIRRCHMSASCIMFFNNCWERSLSGFKWS